MGLSELMRMIIIFVTFCLNKKKNPTRKKKKITDPRSRWQHNNNEKVPNIVRITKMWPRDVKWANAVGKMVPNRLNTGLPQTFNLLKMQYLQSTIKWCMPIQYLKGHVISWREHLLTHRPGFKSQIWFDNLGQVTKPLIHFPHISFIELSWQSALSVHQEN